MREKSEKRLKVLLMTPSLYYGGEEISTINIARELKRRGHEPVYMSSSGPLEKSLRDHGIRFVRADIRGRGPFGLLKGALAIRKFLEREPVSVIHSQTPWPAIMAAIARRFLKIKAPIIWHNRGIRKSNYRYVARIANLLFDFVVSNSDDEEFRLISNGLDRVRSVRIHNGLNLDDYDIASPRKTDLKKELSLNEGSVLIGMVGRLDEEKGPKWLLEAASILNAGDELNNARFVFIGDGPQRALLERLAFDRGLRQKVFFLGFRNDVCDVYKNLDALAVPSESESFGNVIIEAMLMGVPVAASNVGGVKEIIADRENGLLFGPKDPYAIADALKLLFDDGVMRKRISEGGRRRVLKYFNTKRVVDDLEEIYTKVIGSNGQI